MNIKLLFLSLLLSMSDLKAMNIADLWYTKTEIEADKKKDAQEQAERPAKEALALLAALNQDLATVVEQYIPSIWLGCSQSSFLPGKHIRRFSWSPTGNCIAIPELKPTHKDGKYSIKIYDVKKMEKIKEFTNAGTVMAFHPTKPLIATGFNYKKQTWIKIWNIDSEQEKYIRFINSQNKNLHLDWSPDGTKLAFGGNTMIRVDQFDDTQDPAFSFLSTELLPLLLV